jgi:hypothetical protein
MNFINRIQRPWAPALLLTTLLLGGQSAAAGASAADSAAADSAAADSAAANKDATNEHLSVQDRNAIAVMDAFLSAFNARDEAAWADSLQFPHVRLASQTVTVYPDREAFLAAMDLDQFASSSGWRYSTWDDMSVIQSSPNKVHIKVKFSRFDASDTLLASFDSLYVIEKIDGRWGVRARSSFAP